MVEVSWAGGYGVIVVAADAVCPSSEVGVVHLEGVEAGFAQAVPGIRSGAVSAPSVVVRPVHSGFVEQGDPIC